MKSPKVLIIQTAFIGDVILATSLIEYIKQVYPESTIDFFLRKGNESLIETSPHIKKLYIWEKKINKFKNLIKLIFQIRKEKYDITINVQRFFNSGLVCALSGAKVRVGFHSNPLAIFFDHKIEHKIPYKYQEGYLHEVQRNQLLLQDIVQNFSLRDAEELKPKLYFTDEDEQAIKHLLANITEDFYVLAPSSVWYTKQWHHSKWKDLISKLKDKGIIYLIGGPDDKKYLSSLVSTQDKIIILAGKLSLRQSALLMRKAKRVFVNDSAPLHLASSVNANTTAIFCSTIPAFGYFPLSDNSRVVQVKEKLSCRPCGLHGHNQCPLDHFKCAKDISVDELMLDS